VRLTRDYHDQALPKEIRKSMEEKSRDFKMKGSQIYLDAT